MRKSFLALLSFVLFASSCSLGPREQWVELIRNGYEKAVELKTVRVRQAVSVRVIETTIRQEPSPLIARSAGAADIEAGTAQMVDAKSSKRQVFYDDLAVYVTRSASSVGEGKQGFARLSYEDEPDVDIDDNDRRVAVGAALISPVIALELLDGVLTGSIEEVGRGKRGGASATHYTARLAPDAAITEIDDEDRQEGVRRMFANLAVQQDDFPVDVWIDDEGRVRSIRFVVRQQKDRVNAFTLATSWEYFAFGNEVDIELPSQDETLRSPRFRDLVEDAIREF